MLSEAQPKHAAQQSRAAFSESLQGTMLSEAQLKHAVQQSRAAFSESL
jgi:hypothetical protein